MSKNSALKGVFLVGLGATSYGMLATFVKLAYAEKGVTGLPFTPAEVISAQFIIGILAILLINAFQKSKKGNEVQKASVTNIKQLMLAGTSTGLTSIFYYLAVKYIPVSIGIVLLMQTVWMGVVLEMILEKKLPSKTKVIAVIIVLIGTLLATNILQNLSLIHI
jgi:drug/metabolite transporter (DMT)-like permease